MSPKSRVFAVLVSVSMMTCAALAQEGAAEAKPALEAEAVAALERMGAFLRTLPSFQVQAKTSLEQVLMDGQKIQFPADVDILVRRPNGLRAEVSGEKQHRFYFYDGTSFTLWASRLNVYATAPAPATLAELAERLSDKFGIELPLTDLFYWGTRGTDNTVLTSGFVVGPGQIGGTSCMHYAFRQSDVDWEVWIQQGDYPLPRRIVITATDDESRPSYISEMTWNLAPSFNDATFKFQPDAGALKITFAETSAQ